MFESVACDRIKRVPRERTYAGVAGKTEGFISGTVVFNSEDLLESRRRIKAERLNKVKGATERKKESEAKKAAKAMEDVARAKRVTALRKSFPTVTEAQWKLWARSLSKFYKGKKPLNWAKEKVKGKMA